MTDIFATASDCDDNSFMTRRFFATVQKKLHFTMHRRTAAELTVSRADAEKHHMGFTFWNAKTGEKIIRSKVLIAKNCLSKEDRHAQALGFHGSGHGRAAREATNSHDNGRPAEFLIFNEMGVPQGPGSVSSDAIRSDCAPFDSADAGAVRQAEVSGRSGKKSAPRRFGRKAPLQPDEAIPSG